MFGIVVWDERGGGAVLARDRLGIKPLYYAAAGDLLVFGSELKSVLASGIVDVELDYEAIDAYLTLGFFPAPLTPLLGVRKLDARPHARRRERDGRASERSGRIPAPNARSRARSDEQPSACSRSSTSPCGSG